MTKKNKNSIWFWIFSPILLIPSIGILWLIPAVIIPDEPNPIPIALLLLSLATLGILTTICMYRYPKYIFWARIIAAIIFLWITIFFVTGFLLPIIFESDPENSENRFGMLFLFIIIGLPALSYTLYENLYFNPNYKMYEDDEHPILHLLIWVVEHFAATDYLIQFNVTNKLIVNSGVNSDYAQSIIFWLRDKIYHKVQMTNPRDDDWGWYSELCWNETKYILELSAIKEGNYMVQCSLQIKKRRSLIEKLRGRNKMTPEDECLQYIFSTIESEPEFKNVGVS